MNKTNLEKLTTYIDDAKASDIAIIDVRGQTVITDYMVICTGRSGRHVLAVADDAAVKMKALGLPSLNGNSDKSDTWALVDFGDIILHVMQAETRELYKLEELWS
jgi:ribosome-associated protein